MLDIIGSIVLVGMLMVTIVTINSTMTMETSKDNNTLNTQAELIQVVRFLEFDLYKIGYRVSKPYITAAETSRIVFKADLLDKPSGTDVVEYTLGPSTAWSTNSNIRQLYRTENSSKVTISSKVTKFKFLYYNSRDSLLGAPLSGALLDSIRAIRVQVRVESAEALDSVYAGGYYENCIRPKNLK